MAKAKSMPTNKVSQYAAKSAISARKRKQTKVKPTQILLNSKEARALQKQWYAKLATTGFKDLEYFGGERYEANDLLKGDSMRSIANRYNNAHLHYYRLWSCFLAYTSHNLSPRERLISKLYAEGLTYREISDTAGDAGFKAHSVAVVFNTIEKLKPRVIKWNKTSPNGLDFEPDI